ncbi:MAG: hypothetical protein EOP84_09310 [Verrucomicrobiaceae bacterium]|nr:MAG: hypothetical protein EOP84_09310 [Verrucomicrobiaceae bacterium]
MLVLSGKQVLRFKLNSDSTKLPEAEVLVNGLDDPQQITVAPDGTLLVTDGGKSHQVKVFASDGKPVGLIGRGGAPRSGPYDPAQLTNPYGVTVDGQGRIWVAEKDKQPKRVSVWTRDGKLVNAFYGPADYGGGGEIDPRDPSRFYYFGMEMQLDRTRGTSVPTAILCRRDDPDTEPLLGDWPPLPQTAFYRDGHRYLTNCYSSHPTNGAPYVVLWQADGQKAREVAAAGAAIEWGAFGTLFAPKERFAARWTGQIMPEKSETYTFHTTSDSSVRLWLDGKLLIDRWSERKGGEGAGEIKLEANRPVLIRLEHANYGGPARLQLAWSAPNLPRELVPAEALRPSAYATGQGLKVQFYRESDIEKSDVRNPLVEGVLANVDADFSKGAPLDERAARFISRIPADVRRDRDRVFFLWSDTNGNGQPDAEEVTFTKSSSGGLTVMPDLSLVVSRLEGKTMRWQPIGFSADGTPHYDLAKGEVLAQGSQSPSSSGGDQALVGRDGWTVLTVAPEPFARQGFGGVQNGKPRWSYPSLWPGLHASHHAPMAEEPGVVLGSTRLLGGLVSTHAGEVFAINGNKGNVYLLTTDGLFVGTLFADSRRAAWDMETAKPVLRVTENSLGEESFWPHITQTEKGAVYLSGNGVLLHLYGLGSLKRLPEQTLDVTSAMLTAAQALSVQQAQANQPADAKTSLRALNFGAPPKIDGNLEEWKDADWGPIDSRMVEGSRKKMETQAAFAFTKDRLYAAWKTGDPKLLRNSGEVMRNLFKSGGALDLQLESIAGGLRLLVSEVDGKPVAVVFQPKDPQRTGEPVEYTSNIGTQKTVKMDRVELVTDQVELGSDGKGNYELSVPWSVLRLNAPPQGKLRGDLGLLRGNGTQTLQRVYWRNKASGIVSDLASEAELEPKRWGEVEFSR